jgi:hypothetical protein
MAGNVVVVESLALQTDLHIDPLGKVETATNDQRY